MIRLRHIVIAACFVSVLACERSEPEIAVADVDHYELVIPEGFPAPEIPEDNQLTQSRVALGKKLFFDTRLSRTNTISCGSCHLQEQAFADSRALSLGVDDRVGKRNSPSLVNLAYGTSFFWEGGVPTLEMQVLSPLDNELEMDFNITQVVERLQDDPEYVLMAEQAYGRPFDPFVITRAIAAYERTLISGNSRYDQHVNGNEMILTAQEQEGMELFNSERLQCNSCHQGFNFTTGDFVNNGIVADIEADPGRQQITLEASDLGKFKVPSLRNVEVTAPYMHDASLTSLEAVVDHYASGGFKTETRDPRITGFTISEDEKAALVAFLRTLTDAEFLSDPAHQ